jgi:hypothetical protein
MNQYTLIFTKDGASFRAGVFANDANDALWMADMEWDDLSLAHFDAYTQYDDVNVMEGFLG